jgi:hypothetical protein
MSVVYSGRYTCIVTCSPEASSNVHNSHLNESEMCDVIEWDEQLLVREN